MIKPGTPLSIGLALALPLVLLALIYAAAVNPIVAAFEARQQRIAAQADLLQHYRRIAANAPAYARTLETLRDDPWMRTAFFDGENSAIVAAALQQQAKSIIQNAGGALQSAQILPDTTEDGVRRVTIRVTVASDIDALRGFLMRIQGNTPLLVVEFLEIVSKPSRRNRRAAAVDLLESQFDITGFMRDTPA